MSSPDLAAKLLAVSKSFKNFKIHINTNALISELENFWQTD